ncbi:MAG: hypothetical protein R2792_06645 [Saprospiraceae bacterium]
MNNTKFVLIFALSFQLVTGTCYGQIDDISLCKVEYYQPNEDASYWIRIKEDGLSGVELSGEVSTVAWESTSGNITKKPVAYVSGSTARIGACFKKEGTNKVCVSNETGADLLFHALRNSRFPTMVCMYW